MIKGLHTIVDDLSNRRIFVMPDVRFTTAYKWGNTADSRDLKIAWDVMIIKPPRFDSQEELSESFVIKAGKSLLSELKPIIQSIRVFLGDPKLGDIFTECGFCEYLRYTYEVLEHHLDNRTLDELGETFIYVEFLLFEEKYA